VESISGPNYIGGTELGQGNVITSNAGDGVRINFVSQNAILGNSIFKNTGLGIGLDDDGPTPNDLGPLPDVDAGGNNLQNFPIIRHAAPNSGNLKVTYTVPTVPTSATYPLRVEFFQADLNDQEGQVFLGADTFTEADYAAGGKTVNLATVASFKVFDKIVATATDHYDANLFASTSEFSPVTTIASPWQNPNPLRRWDVTDDSNIVAEDALAIINYINSKGSGLIPPTAANAKPYYDVNGDNNVAANDVLDVINFINSGKGNQSEGEGTSTPELSGIAATDVLTLLATDVAAQSPRRRKL
jgi:hypothetical protein